MDADPYGGSGGITALTGDVTASGSGSVAATLAASITGAKAFTTSVAVGGATIGSNALAVLGQTGIGIGAQSAANIFGTTGYNLHQPTGTDTDTGSSGTIALTYVNSWGVRTLASSSATTLTTLAGNYFDAPTNGTNVTLTNTAIPVIINNSAASGGLLGFSMPGNSSGFRTFVWIANATGFKVQRWSDSFGTPSSSVFGVDNGCGNDCLVAFNNLRIGGLNVYLTTPSSAVLQFGAADANPAVAQTTQVQSSITGSNVAGANWSLIGSRGTGTGPSGNIIFKVGLTGTTGTTQNTAYPLLSLNAGNATGATVQFGDGTNFTTYDSCTALTTGSTGVVACTGSAMRFKNLQADLSLLRHL